ncbi:fructose-bisphosphatase, partial [Sarracenia purpurea var. burkii]
MDHAADAHRTDLMTITRFVLNEQSKHPESRGDFTILLSHIVLGCKFVCSAVSKVLPDFWDWDQILPYCVRS